VLTRPFLFPVIDSYSAYSSTGAFKLSPMLWAPVGLLLAQFALDFVMVAVSRNVGLGSVWFQPTSDLFFKEKVKSEPPPSQPYPNQRMNESGRRLMAEPSFASTSFNPNSLGYNQQQQQPYQISPPAPSSSTAQSYFGRRKAPGQYVEMTEQSQYENANYARQPLIPTSGEPQTPGSPFKY
jgi:hypothetical protein